MDIPPNAEKNIPASLPENQFPGSEPPLPQANPPIIVEGKKKTNFKLLIILFVLALVIGGGVYVYINYFYQATPESNQEVAIQEPSPTASWLSYVNNQYGFQLKYPPTWEILSDTASTIDIRPEGKNGLRVSIVNSTKDLDSYLLDVDLANATTYEGKPSRDILEIKNATVDNLPAIQRKEQLNAPGFPILITYFKSGDNIYGVAIWVAEGSYSAQDEEIYNQILSSFKFIK